MDLFNDWVKTTGIYNLSWENFVMFGVAFFFMYLAIKKNMESYELLPIGLGVIIANLPLAGMATFDPSTGVHQSSGFLGNFISSSSSTNFDSESNINEIILDLYPITRTVLGP